jgi:mRNA interferase MazF
MTSDQPAQCDVWLARLDPTEGHEQAGARPVLVISRDAFNAAGWRLCLCVPLSTRDRGPPLHVRIDPPEGGVRTTSFALVDQVRALDRSRLQQRWGAVDPAKHRQIVALLLRIVAPR